MNNIALKAIGAGAFVVLAGCTVQSTQAEDPCAPTFSMYFQKPIVTWQTLCAQKQDAEQEQQEQAQQNADEAAQQKAEQAQEDAAAAQQAAQAEQQAEAAAKAQQEQAKHDVLVKVEAAADESNPTPRLQNYINDMQAALATMATAKQAVGCQIRTQLWFNVLNYGFRSIQAEETQKIPLTEVDLAAANALFQTAINVQPAADCSTLASSDELSDADQRESAIAVLPAY